MISKRKTRTLLKWALLTVTITVIASLFICINTTVKHSTASEDEDAGVDEAGGGQPRDVQLVRAGVRRLHGAVSHVARFGPLAAGTPVLVARARRRRAPLRRLLARLRRVHYIQTALLVVSHAHYDDRINALVQSVDFCRVLQIFYLYSVQLHPTGFPGPAVGDCGAPDAADDAECSPRDPRRVEDKQHWWWTANYAFERLDPVVGPTHFIFLEDTHVIAPDLLYMAMHAQRALGLFPNAHLLTLGGPAAAPAPTPAPDTALLLLDDWSQQYAAGIAFNRSMWREISALSAHFCFFNDTSWSRSMANVFAHLPARRATVVRCAAPRVWAAAGGGARAPAPLYPARVRVQLRWRPRAEAPPPPPAPAPRGGWADLRDQMLCLDPSALDVLDDNKK